MKLKDNKIYRWIAIPICIAMCFLGRFIPTNGVLTSDAMGVIFIFLGSLILWLTIGIDWPSLVCIFALAFLDNLSFGSVLQSSFGNSTFIFLLFTFVCTYALSKTSLIKRIAISFVNSKLAKKSGFLFISLFLTSVLLLGLFISPSVLFVVILPILKEILSIAKIEKGHKVAKVMLLGLGFTVSISSGMTPIAHVFPLLAMSAAHIEVSSLVYMGIAIPTGVVIFLLMLLMFFIYLRKDADVIKGIDVSSLKENIKKIDAKDIVTLVIFIVVILLWILPSIFKNVSIEFYDAINQYGTAMPPLLGTILLCVIRIKNEPIIKIDDALKNGIPWGSLLMCAATLVLGSALTNNDIGIKTVLSNAIGSSIGSLPILVLLIIFVSWAAIQTNLSSNMVTATLVASVAGTVLASSNIATNEYNTIICLIGMMASFAFATPPCMPHIAIVAGDENCSTKDVLIFGSILMVISIICACLIGYPIGLGLFNL